VVTETVQVDAVAVQVDTSTSTLKEIVDRARIAELPLNSRDAARLTTLVVGPSFFTFDAIAQKNFYIAERYKLQFRVEVFNPFNRVELGDPEVNASNSNFGRIRTSNPNYTPRSIQLGFRLDF